MSLSDLARKFERLATKLDTAQVVDGLVDMMQTRLEAVTFSDKASGRTKANLTTKSHVARLGRGHLVSGLGSKNVMGDWDAPAPRGTLRAFFEDNKKDGAYTIKPNKWRYLSPFAKQKLEDERLTGKYGGASAAAAGKSPYALMLDGTSAAQMASASRAGITPTHYIGRAFDQFSKNDVPTYVNRVIQEALNG